MSILVTGGTRVNSNNFTLIHGALKNQVQHLWAKIPQHLMHLAVTIQDDPNAAMPKVVFELELPPL